MLTGYANAQGNGFADIRVMMRGTCTRDDLVTLVRGVLLENAFSRAPEGAPPLLKAIVDEFGAEPDKIEWLKTPVKPTGLAV